MYINAENECNTCVKAKRFIQASSTSPERQNGGMRAADTGAVYDAGQYLHRRRRIGRGEAGGRVEWPTPPYIVRHAVLFARSYLFWPVRPIAAGTRQ